MNLKLILLGATALLLGLAAPSGAAGTADAAASAECLPFSGYSTNPVIVIHESGPYPVTVEWTNWQCVEDPLAA